MKKPISMVHQAVELFRTLDPYLPSQVISVFLEVAANDGPVETRDLPKKLGMPQSSVNRALTTLAETHWKDREKPGLFLLEHRVSPLDRRQRLVQLTPKGKKMVADIERLFRDR